MRRSVGLCAVVLVTTACARGAEPDAYGNVEATQVTVSAETAGRLVTFDVHEGQMLDAAAVVGRINPSELELQKQQADAQRAASDSRADEATRQPPIVDPPRA